MRFSLFHKNRIHKDKEKTMRKETTHIAIACFLGTALGLIVAFELADMFAYGPNCFSQSNTPERCFFIFTLLNSRKSLE